ncbi:MAG TPA: YciI family protein [Terriglobales bacterium]|nr:YciI family protein [Terriglobales bacterium]
MRYMLLIYSNEIADANPKLEDFAASMDAHRSLMDETSQRGILLGASPLKPSGTATTIRGTADGNRLITDGPYAETKEQLAGYYLLECKDLDEAIAYAKRIPLHCIGGATGAVEIRPVREFSEVQQQFEALAASQPA